MSVPDHDPKLFRLNERQKDAAARVLRALLDLPEPERLDVLAFVSKVYVECDLTGLRNQGRR